MVVKPQNLLVIMSDEHNPKIAAGSPSRPACAHLTVIALF
jgi:hypothetical protein